MTMHFVTDTAKGPNADLQGAGRNGAPIRTDNAPLPAIQHLELIHRAERRPAPPAFDGEADNPFNIADVVRQVEDAADATAGSWPALQNGDDGGAKDPWRELSARRVQISKLHKIQQKQVAALKQARNLIESLGKSVNLFRDGYKLREREAAAAKQALQVAEQEKRALRAELDQTQADYAELLQKAADLGAEFDQREQDVAAMRESVAALQAKWAAEDAHEDDLTVAIEDAKARGELDRRYARFKAQIETLANMIGVRDERIRNLEEDNARLAARCRVLATSVQALKSADHDAQEQLKSHAAVVKFLDATLRTEREATSKLVADLQRERLERAAHASESAMVCKEIVRLLPRLAGQPGQAPEAVAPKAGA